MLSVRRFHALTSSYGGDLARWPDTERAAAELLLASRPELASLLAEARVLDRLIETTQARRDAALMLPGEESAALERLRDAVGRSTAKPPRRIWGRGVAASLSGVAANGSGALSAGVLAPRLALGMLAPAAIVLGLWLGVTNAAPLPEDGLLTALSPSPIHMLLRPS